MSGNLLDRLHGRYPMGPIMPDGEPEFGFRQFETTPIQREAAYAIERLTAELKEAREEIKRLFGMSQQVRQPEDAIDRMITEARREGWNAAVEAAKGEARDQERACIEWHDKTGSHANVYEQIAVIVGRIGALAKPQEDQP